MPDGYVEYGRWDEAHRATLLRLMGVEQQLHELAGAEQVHRSLTDRLKALEEAGTAEEAAGRGRRDRLWTLAIVLVSGVVFPLLVSALVTYLHLRSTH